jgi:hypothetical protein
MRDLMEYRQVTDLPRALSFQSFDGTVDLEWFVTHFQINRIEQPNFVEMDDVFEVPTDQYINLCDSSQGNMQRIRIVFGRQNLTSLICFNQCNGWFGNFQNFRLQHEEIFILGLDRFNRCKCVEPSYTPVDS